MPVTVATFCQATKQVDGSTVFIVSEASVSTMVNSLNAGTDLNFSACPTGMPESISFVWQMPSADTTSLGNLFSSAIGTSQTFGPYPQKIVVRGLAVGQNVGNAIVQATKVYGGVRFDLSLGNNLLMASRVRSFLMDVNDLSAYNSVFTGSPGATAKYGFYETDLAA